MKIIIGLGNPGEKYSETRHNAGQMLVDRISNDEKWQKNKGILVAKFPEMVLVKSAEYWMNESGRMMGDLNYFEYLTLDPSPRLGEGKMFNSLYICHDDLDIRLGEYKIQFGVGPKVHNGVTSIVNALGTDQFWRVRIGVDNRQIPTQTGEDYVLDAFRPEEQKIIDLVLEKIAHEMVEKIIV